MPQLLCPNPLKISLPIHTLTCPCPQGRRRLRICNPHIELSPCPLDDHLKQRIMPTPRKWTLVKDYFKGPYSFTFGSDLFVPKQDFLLFFSPECCFVLGTDQFPLTAVLTSWELPAMMCPGSPSSYVPHRHKMLQHCVMSGDHWPHHHGRRKQGKERMEQCPSRYSNTEQNTSVFVLSSWFFKTFSHCIISSLQKIWNQSLYPILIHTAALQSSLPSLSLPLQENHSPWGTPAVPYLIWITSSSFWVYFGE